MTANLLAQETSPYLLLHKENPVHWRAWGPEALAQAEAENKPILLSIGYTACHWCHVMNRESFSDPQTAELMNALFVNIKVDREERPDLDQLYQTAASQLGGGGGWPLTMFLSPKGEPFFAGTYFPPEDRYGQPGFRRVLQDVSRIWREKPDPVNSTISKVAQGLAALWARDTRGQFPPDISDQTAIHIAQRFDIFFGGLTGAPKFPSTALIELCWRAYLRNGAAQFQQVVYTSLDNMCLAGIYDHLGGGFARYSTDERWTVPHFEKMLYDNALLIDVLTLVWQQEQGQLYRERVEETIGWVLRDMKAGDGFASSLDAESEGEEGRYYLWTEAEVDATLAGTFVKRFKEIYNIRQAGNWQGRTILHRLGATYPLPEADEALLKKQRALLLAARYRRPPPQRDDKVLADSNGMMISALANAGAAMRNPEWIEAAKRAFAFVERALGDGDRLYHSWRDGKRQHTGFADDYAHMARGALALWEATQDGYYLKRAQAWAYVLNEHFWDAQNGGYFFTADDAESLLFRSRMVFDQAALSGNGVMVEILAKLYFATFDDIYRERANALIQAFAGEISRAYISMGSYLNGLETVLQGLQIVVIGPAQNRKTQELLSAVWGRSLPTRTLVQVEPGTTLSEIHPAHGKTMLNGQPTAYFCVRSTCSAPITDPVTLSQALQLPARVAGQA
jgi:uncharacterized protein